ncbi:MAG: hypothetical protein M3014_04850 [Chloroflexota bacterium]|nr:hypothetical protein [Chloroflexota bacterium]
MEEEREQMGAMSEAGNEGKALEKLTQGKSPWPEPTVLTWNDLMELPRQIVPAETYAHLRNAGKEVLLAAFSLWRAVESSSLSTGTEKARRRIDVE